MDEIPFDEWMRRLDAVLLEFLGIASDCLPDCPYSEWHEAGATPRRAAVLAVRRIAGPGDADEPIVHPHPRQETP